MKGKTNSLVIGTILVLFLGIVFFLQAQTSPSQEGGYDRHSPPPPEPEKPSLKEQMANVTEPPKINPNAIAPSIDTLKAHLAGNRGFTKTVPITGRTSEEKFKPQSDDTTPQGRFWEKTNKNR